MPIEKKKKKKESIVQGRTPEEAEKSRQEQSDFLRQREKRKQQLLDVGVTRKEAGIQATTEVETGIKQREQEQQAFQLKQEAATPLEQAGAFEEVTPKEVSLEPTPQADIPIGGVAGASILMAIGANTKVKNVLGTERVAGAGAITGEEAFPETPETIREAALQVIKQKSYDEGISNSESFGAMVEAIPGVGSLVGKYVGGLVEAPYANSKNVIDEINKVKEAASTGQEKVRNGLEDPEYGLTRARQMEEDLAKLEGRIKLLINTSAILRANSDEVNKIQEQILEAREKVNRYKTASSFGYTAQLTGTGRVIPTDEQIYFELKGGK